MGRSFGRAVIDRGGFRRRGVGLELDAGAGFAREDDVSGALGDQVGFHPRLFGETALADQLRVAVGIADEDAVGVFPEGVALVRGDAPGAGPFGGAGFFAKRSGKRTGPAFFTAGGEVVIAVEGTGPFAAGPLGEEAGATKR